MCESTEQVSLCARAQMGDREAEEQLLRRGARIVRGMVRSYFLPGGESEDLLQEGMIALVAAIREYCPARGASFETFSATCIRNRLNSVLRVAKSNRHQPLNNSLPLDGSEQLPRNAAKVSSAQSPEDTVIGKEHFAGLLCELRALLSAFENQVLSLYLQGHAYKEMAERLGKSEKAVDNAVVRIRIKCAKHFPKGEFR